MNAEIINVASDILIGDRVDLNSNYIAKNLSMCGIKINAKTTVGGKQSTLSKALTTASFRSQLVIITGGLGPLEQDITRQTFCLTFNLKLTLDKESLIKIENHYHALGRETSEAVIKQAYVPKGSTVFPNEVGLIPGCSIIVGETRFILLPGNFNDMKLILDKYVLPLIIDESDVVCNTKILNVVSLSRLTIEEKLGGLLHSNNPKATLIEGNCEYKIKVFSYSDNEAVSSDLCESYADKIIKKLGENVYGENFNSVSEKVIELLKQKNKKIAVAESCTGGLVAANLVSVSGASDVFDFSACTYSNKMKSLALNVNPKTIEIYGAVSAQTAAEMAIGMKEISGADIALSVTGVAGPHTSENKPVGLVYFGLFDGKKVWTFKFKINNSREDRNIIRNISAVTAVDIVRRYLINSPVIQNNGTEPNEKVNPLDYVECVNKTLRLTEKENKKITKTQNVFSDEELTDYINQIFSNDF